MQIHNESMQSYNKPMQNNNEAMQTHDNLRCKNTINACRAIGTNANQNKPMQTHKHTVDVVG